MEINDIKVTNPTIDTTYGDSNLVLRDGHIRVAKYVPEYNADIYDPTGYNYSETHDDSLKFRSSDRYVKVAGTHEIYFKGRKYTKTDDSIQVPATTGNWIVYYDSTMTMRVTQDLQPYYLPWVAYVYWNNTQGIGICGDERHRAVIPWKSHEEFHQTVGTYWRTGLALTAGNTSFSLDAGAVKDEDIIHQHGAQTSCNLFYYDGSATFTIDTGNTTLYKGTVGSLYYNDGTTLAAAPANSYMAIFLFGTNDINGRPISVIGQRTDVLLADAEDNNTLSSLSLSGFPINEYVLLYIVFYRNDATPFEKAVDYRASSVSTGGGSSTNDHTLLSNLNTPDYYHPTQANYTDLTDAGYTELHKHGFSDSCGKADSVETLGSNVGDNGYIQKALNGKLVNSTIYEPASDAVTIDANLSSKRIVLNAGAAYQPALYTNNTDSGAAMLAIIHSDRDVVFTNFLGRLVLSDSIWMNGDTYYSTSPRIGPLTSNRVVYSDASDRLTSSSVTATTLSYLDISSSLTGLLSLKADTTYTYSKSVIDAALLLKASVSGTNGQFTVKDGNNLKTVSSIDSTEFKALDNISGNIQTQINGKQDFDSDLQTISSLINVGLIARIGTGLWDTRFIATTGNGITVNNADGVSGSPQLNLTYGTTANTVCEGDDDRLLTTAQKIDLTDGGASSAHYHTSDRDRSNHSGTQAISTVGGLQTALDAKAPLSHGVTTNYYANANSSTTLNEAKLLDTLGGVGVKGKLSVSATTLNGNASYAQLRFGKVGNMQAYNGVSTATATYRTSNEEYDTSGNWRFLVDGYAMMYLQDAGYHKFRTSSASGTAGNVVTNTDVFWITPGGDLQTFGNQISYDGSGSEGISFDASNYLTLYNGSSGGSKDSRARFTLEDNLSLAFQFLSPSTTEQSILFGSNLDTDDGAIRYNLYDHKFTFRVSGTDGIVINYNNEIGLNSNYINNNGTSDRGLTFDNNHKGYFTDGLDVTKKARIDSIDVNYMTVDTIAITEVTSPCTLYDATFGDVDIDVARKVTIGNMVKVFIPRLDAALLNGGGEISVKFSAGFLPTGYSSQTFFQVFTWSVNSSLFEHRVYLYGGENKITYTTNAFGGGNFGPVIAYASIFEYYKN